MTMVQCSCGYAGATAGDFGDHLQEAFTPAEDVGTDGRVHGEVAADCATAITLGRAKGQRTLACFCGFTGTVRELDDHVLARFTTPDRVGVDRARPAAEPRHARTR